MKRSRSIAAFFFNGGLAVRRFLVDGLGIAAGSASATPVRFNPPLLDLNRRYRKRNDDARTLFDLPLFDDPALLSTGEARTGDDEADGWENGLFHMLSS